jgi:hypothetical protein
MRQCARIAPANDMVTIDVCAASPPVCHFVSVTGRIAYLTVSKLIPKRRFFDRA